MGKSPLGRLEQVELRGYWESESADFTPWLGKDENMALLGEALGMELEIEALEKDVGSFRADIVCRDISTDHRVLIENQLEKTNHAHLGQIITYAAGLGASTVVWIAKRFTEEHREALGWLNEASQDAFRFFGLEVELWRIGDSAPAPKFNIVAKPNDWTKAVRESAGNGGGAKTPSRQMQHEFWKAFVEHLKSHHSPLRIPTPQPRHWMHFRLGRSGFYLSAVASSYNSATRSYEIGEIRAQLLIQSRDASAIYRQLQLDKAEIERAFGGTLEWSESEDVNRRRIGVRSTVDIEDRKAWPAQHEWLRVNLESLQRIFGPRARLLEGDGPEEADGTMAPNKS